jgi:hypothetical protein
MEWEEREQGGFHGSTQFLPCFISRNSVMWYHLTARKGGKGSLEEKEIGFSEHIAISAT